MTGCDTHIIGPHDTPTRFRVIVMFTDDQWAQITRGRSSSLPQRSPDDPPTPLTEQRTIPPFPTEVLPGPFADMAIEVSEFTQTDPGMAGTTIVTMMAACAGGRVEVEVKPGWREPLNLYTVTVADPGERKSAVQAVLSVPLLDAERELVDQVRDAITETQVQKDMATKRALAAQAKAVKADGEKSLEAEAISAALMAESIVVPTLPRIVADDVTPEATGSLLAGQQGRLAIISAEGGIFDVIGGRYSGNIPNLDVFLKGHAGDMLKVDRKGRDPEYVKRPALTLGLMIQPLVLTTIARNDSFRGRGLLARFLYAMPLSNVGRRKVDTTSVTEATSAQYEAAVHTLAITLQGWEDPVILSMTPDAVDGLLAYAATVEPRLGASGDLHHIRDWGSKLVGAVARMAGLLHLADDPAGSWRQPVVLDDVDRAIRLGEFFTEHTVTAFGAMRADPVLGDAQYLLDVIRRHGWVEISKRDLHVASSRSRFPKVADLDPAIGLLVEHGYIVSIEEPLPTGGRRASPRLHISHHVHATQAAQATEG